MHTQTRWAVGLILLVPLFSGCVVTSDEPGSTPPSPFALEVQIVGYDNGTTPVGKANVTLLPIGSKESPLTATTDGSGRASFSVPRDSRFQLVWEADGWSRDASVGFEVPPAKPKSAGWGDFIKALVTAVACIASLGLACETVPSVALLGDAATLQFHVVRLSGSQAYAIPVEPHVSAYPISVVSSRDWFPKSLPLRADPVENAVYLAHMRGANGTLRWTNQGQQVGDFGLLIDCYGYGYSNVFDGWTDTSGGLTQGSHSVRAAWTNPKETGPLSGWWSNTTAPCPGVAAGPWVKKLSTPMEVRVDLAISFGGVIQAPLVLEGNAESRTELKLR